MWALRRRPDRQDGETRFPELVQHDELTAEFKFGGEAHFSRSSPGITIALDAGSSVTVASVQSKLQGATTKTTTTAPIATTIGHGRRFMQSTRLSI